jgi:ferredoxin
MLKDIETENDIYQWQTAFYKHLLNDPITSPKFSHLNLEEHMPKIVAFWSFVLLEKEGYKTNVFEKHIHLNLEKIHFEKRADQCISCGECMSHCPQKINIPVRMQEIVELYQNLKSIV